MRKSRLYKSAIAVVAAAGGAVVGPAALSAQASPPPATAATTTTFTINGGSLTVTAPASAPLGTASIGSPSISAALGTVTVSDQRAVLNGGWTASVISSSFTTGGDSPAETLAAADASYAPGPLTSAMGTGSYSPGNGGPMGSSQTAWAASAETGATSVSWDPTITVTIPGSALAGAYSGTITHSVG